MATIGYLTPRGSRGSGTRPNAVSNDSRSPSVTSSGATSTAPGRGKRSSKTGAVRHDGMAGTVLHADLDAWHTHDQRGWAVPAPSPRSACRTSNPTPPHPLTDNAMALRRQVFDLPPISIRVTEHELVSRRCRCGVTTTADGPAGVNAPVQYGARINAVMVYLYMGQYLSKHRTAVAMSELFGTPVSDGTVSAATARAAVAHFDETGFRADGKLHWLHSASTTMFTMITCHRRRGREAMNAAGILPAFTGIAVHDAWAPYDLTRANRLVTTFELAEDGAGGVGEVGFEGEALAVDLD